MSPSGCQPVIRAVRSKESGKSQLGGFGYIIQRNTGNLNGDKVDVPQAFFPP
mgnify:FL=1